MEPCAHNLRMRLLKLLVHYYLKHVPVACSVCVGCMHKIYAFDVNTAMHRYWPGIITTSYVTMPAMMLMYTPICCKKGPFNEWNVMGAF